jgi:hypothetical protein
VLEVPTHEMPLRVERKGIALHSLPSDSIYMDDILTKENITYYEPIYNMKHMGSSTHSTDDANPNHRFLIEDDATLKRQ